MRRVRRHHVVVELEAIRLDLLAFTWESNMQTIFLSRLKFSEDAEKLQISMCPFYGSIKKSCAISEWM